VEQFKLMIKTNFYMITERRSGSHFLASLLNNNPHIRCGSEALNEDLHDKYGYKQDEILRGNMTSLANGPGYKWSDPIPDDPNYPMALGCTMHGNKVAKLSSQEKKLLFGSIEIKKILFRRDNLLNRYFSLQKARKTGFYMQRNHPDKEYTPPSLKLNYLFTRWDFHKITRRYNTIKDQLERQNNQVLELVYEDVVKDPVGEMGKVFKFLEMPVPEDYSTSPKWSKQEKRKNETAILNYEQLKRRFSGTKWERFFEK
jgi:LPS sulfotransferase NodH